MKPVDEERKRGQRLVLILTRSVQLLFMVIVVSLIAHGPGFHLRQTWIGFSSKNSELIECSMTLQDRVKSEAKAAKDNECLLEGSPDLPVSSLRGHYGSAGPGIWGDLSMSGQYFCLPFTIIMLLFMLVLTAPLCINKDSVLPKMVTMAGLVAGICIMFITTALEFWYFKCGGYISAKLTNFDEVMKNFEDMLKYDEKNRIVVCYVQGYAVAGFFSILCTLIFIFDALFVFKMEPDDNAASEKPAEPASDASAPPPPPPPPPAAS